MTPILSAAICIGLFHVSGGSQYLYHIEVLDSSGVLSTSNIEALETRQAKLTEFFTNGSALGIELTPSYKTESATKNSLVLDFYDKDQRRFPAQAKCHAADIFECRPNEVVYYLVKGNTVKRLHTMNPTVHQGETLISVTTKQDLPFTW